MNGALRKPGRGLGVALACLLLVACAGAPIRAPQAADFGAPRLTQQRLHLRQGERDVTVELTVNVAADHVDIVGSRLGVSWFQRRLERDVAVAPAARAAAPGAALVEPLLLALDLILASDEALVTALRPGWKIARSGPQRVLSYRGRPRIRIDFRGADPWNGRTEFTDPARGLRLVLDSVDVP